MKRMFLAIAILAIVMLYVILRYDTTTIIYDCSMAEWHPSIPEDVRNECRRLEEKARKYI